MKLYVAELPDGVVKVGRTTRGMMRVLDHFLAAGAHDYRYWMSAWMAHGVAAETHLIRECREAWGEPVVGREYFRGDYLGTVEMAVSITSEARFNW